MTMCCLFSLNAFRYSKCFMSINRRDRFEEARRENPIIVVLKDEAPAVLAEAPLLREWQLA